MSTTRVRIDLDDPSSLPEGRIDPARADAATEAEIAAQGREAEAGAMRDMARYALRIRRRLGSPGPSGSAHRRPARDDPQPETAQGLPGRRRAGPAAGSGQAPGNRAPRADLNGRGRETGEPRP